MKMNYFRILKTVMDSEDIKEKHDDLQYGDLHKIVLQGIMASGFLDSKGVKTLFTAACDFLKCTKEEKVEKTSMQYVQKVVRGINEEIKPFNMAIRSANCELTGKKFFIFMVTVENSIVKMQMMFTSSEIEIFQKCLDGMMRKYPNFSLPMNECINVLKDIDSRTSLTHAETFINKMISLQYFTKNPPNSEDFDVTLGVRGIREFEPLLVDLYRDVVRSCSLCKMILLHGYRCPGCKILFHQHCYLKYVATCKQCKSCNASWGVRKNMLDRTRTTDDQVEDLEPILRESSGPSQRPTTARQETAATFEPPPTPGNSLRTRAADSDKMPALEPQVSTNGELCFIFLHLVLERFSRKSSEKIPENFLRPSLFLQAKNQFPHKIPEHFSRPFRFLASLKIFRENFIPGSFGSDSTTASELKYLVPGKHKKYQKKIRPSNSMYIKQAIYAQYIVDLKNLERFEFQIVKNLTHTLLATEKLPLGSDIRKLVHVYLTDFYQSSGYSKIYDFIDREETQASHNPMCSYRLIRRVAILLKGLVKHNHFHQIFGILYENIVRFFIQNGWPRIDDMEILAEKILRIQLVHDLDAEQLSNGLITGVQTNCTLNYIHCYEISKVAIRSAQFSAAIQWLELAKEKSFIANVSVIPFIEFSLWNAIEMHNIEFDEEIIMDLEPVFFDREISHVPNDSKDAGKVRNIQQKAFTGKGEKSHENVNYWSICSGKNWQTEIEKKTLTLFKLGNRKMDRKAYILYHRTSVQSFCELPKEKDLRQKTAQHTDLIVERPKASEHLQVLSYSVGGHISPHMDEISSIAETLTPDKFRIATWMLYFNDVKLGGETAFVSVGVSAKPVKGSALLWYNIFSDGEADWGSNHASCPVLLGEKWAADKWVKYGAQIVKRKCSLKQRERYRIPVNRVYLPVPKIPGRN
ncbi:unnamed protein product [Allacma fusca]|uniref:procollagen-proline 4-dioxygenase n=1 Tax=Allacma fusca TaxID=39272 RepID=A0A8J2KVP8_9HEXA|nr:unnamed protein product [Allacma fusca]